MVQVVHHLAHLQEVHVDLIQIVVHHDQLPGAIVPHHLIR